ncbi:MULTISPECIES: hypothetical protein [Streptomyces]|uniref:Uncharacterized protein n=1 Tax=Streptomyces katrae TaxID=68223 RepID=A0ABT7GPH1_9ACTN|nr:MULTISPECIES: hypothetical protein [Streptomyces]MDK9495487.1 hypothetical protein [Streptomyces katrae]RST05485.1 hypothetical protein EF910_13805 [Streptomyces sp. WAC07149]GLX22967.1 hypothetical protein Slala01_66110 [Streptomyces lavendulae subsp. lavendulae]GLX30429.1 hypothetical protein Slala02_62490 [Streptomyces lavendulae subsp. lavendulae]
MKLKRLALTALTAALLTVGVPAAAHAGTAPPTIDPDRGTGGCRVVPEEELLQRFTAEGLASMRASGVLPATGPVRLCTGGGSGNGWGPVPPRDKIV